MNIKEIYCYKSQKKHRQTVRLRDLPYRTAYTLTDVFYAVAGAVNCDDMLIRLQNVINATIVLAQIKNNKICYEIETAENEQIILKIVMNTQTTQTIQQEAYL